MTNSAARGSAVNRSMNRSVCVTLLIPIIIIISKE
jgi:hypothetical protein